MKINKFLIPVFAAMTLIYYLLLSFIAGSFDIVHNLSVTSRFFAVIFYTLVSISIIATTENSDTKEKKE